VSEQTDICTLDYLVGTIATAYKGMITSLVAKDFCISSGDDKTVFKGTVISLPEGTYNISLMHGGHEVIRSSLREGYFELEAETTLTSTAGNLQLDVTQNGKHIGTFLLRKETSSDFYSSAMELSEELRDINFRYLNEQLHGHAGLQKKAESIISAVLSTKKDWKKLSDDINTLSKDLFWTDTDAFINWYELFVRFSARSAKNARKKFESKALSNLLNLMELPLEKEMAGDKLQAVAEIWIREISEGAPNLALRFKNYVKVLHRLRKAVPDVDIRPAVRLLFDSLDSLITVATFIDEEVLVIFRKIMSIDEVKPLEHFGADYRETIFSRIQSDRERLNDQDTTSDVLDAIDSIDPTVLDSGEMIRTLFSLLKHHIDTLSSADLATIMNNVSEITKHISRDVYKYALLQLTRLLDKLISAEKIDNAHVIIEFVAKADETLRDDIVFNTEACAAILRSENDDLIAMYEDILLKIIIPPPSISGFSEQTWEELSNPVHLMRLKGFIDVVSLAPERLRKVMIHFIAMLYINDIFIPDDAIFQREISAYMNSADLEDDFLLHYLLLRKFPVYFHEVGASGMIRDLTTEIDAWGNDPVIYFLRKQVHVNASNHNIDLIESIIRSWTFGKTGPLKETVPREIYESIDPEIIATFSSTITPLFETLGILKDGTLKIKKILHIPDEEIADTVERMQSTDEIRSKILLICKTYKSIVKKYARTDVLSRSVSLTDNVSKLAELKKIFASDQKTEAQESFYYKRHIAFGIPSVIGSYHEPKFDAFGEFLKTEENIRIIMEQLITDIENAEGRPDVGKVRDWLKELGGFKNIFDIHGLSNAIVSEVLEILYNNELSLSQINDLMKVWQKELTWMVEMLYRTFHNPLLDVLDMSEREDLPDSIKGLGGEGTTFLNRASDVIIRDILNSITGFEELDRLLNSLMKCIGHRIDAGHDMQIAVPDNPLISKDVMSFEELPDTDAVKYAPYLGNKAKNLILLFNKGLPVPNGIVFSSAHSFDYEEYVESMEFDTALKGSLTNLEKKTGMALGGRTDPLFVSVRSGSYISMPGILSSILFCGMNETTHKALSYMTGDPWLAWDSYRRFIEHFATIVHRIGMNAIDRISNDILSTYGVASIRELNAGQMEELVNGYSNLLSSKEIGIPEDPLDQIKQSVSAIYRSWFDEKAIQFRKAMNVSENWGTAVTIIPMILANSRNAGASVFFTRKPDSFHKGVYGETRRMATGDDIVYGKLSSRPLSRDQVTEENESLEQFDPELFRLHLDTAEKVEKAMGGIPQEVEAAYISNERGEKELYILQTKRMEFHRGYTEKFQDICRMESSIIGRGIGVHGGALSGIATLSNNPEHIRKLRSDYNEPVILLRHETSTDDVALMPEIDGIITSVGGATSHAAILAQKFDLTAVVGCSDMSIRTDDQGRKYALIGDFELSEGSALSIDGSSGLAYSGVCLLTVKEENY
jgi:pyruvate,orthophosphate dikinase